MGRRNIFPPSGPEPSPSFRFFRTHSQNHRFCTAHVFRRKNKDTLAFLRQDSPPASETFHPQPQCGWARSASFRTSAHTALFFSTRTRTCSSMEKCCGLTPPPGDNSAGLILFPLSSAAPPSGALGWWEDRKNDFAQLFVLTIPTKPPSQRRTIKVRTNNRRQNRPNPPPPHRRARALEKAWKEEKEKSPPKVDHPPPGATGQIKKRPSFQ